MSEQTLNVRFSAILKCPVLGRPPGRPFRCGRSFQRGRFMPGENIARTAGRATVSFPFCSSGLQTGCGRTTRSRTVTPSRVTAVAVPVGCLQPTGLVVGFLALDPACCSAASKKRTFKICANTSPTLNRMSR